MVKQLTTHLFKQLGCQPELVEGGFNFREVPVEMHRLRQAQADSFYRLRVVAGN